MLEGNLIYYPRTAIDVAGLAAAVISIDGRLYIRRELYAEALLEFGPHAIDQRQWRGEGKPETFNFLGFTHICVKKRSNGRFTVLRQTIRKRLQTKLNAVKAELQSRMHEPVPEQGKCCRRW